MLVATGNPALAQQAPAKPPAVGVVSAVKAPVTQSSEYVGRIQATDRVNLIARVDAFLDQRLFTEGAEVKKGDLLYRLEQGPFTADVQAKQAAIDQFQAQLKNAALTLYRAKTLLSTPAGQQSTVDSATASDAALRAQILGAQAQLQQSQINLGYTEIRAPIDGKIGRTAVTIGNYVTPNSGVLATIVSQGPMYVVFGVPSRTAIALRQRAVEKPDAAVIKVRLPDGRLYGQTGAFDFIDNTVAGNTDTITLRGTLSNPPLSNAKTGTTRELVDGEFVTVILEDSEPVEALTIPRAAVLADQGGDYVYVVGADDKAQQRHVQLGPATPGAVAVMGGLAEGERVVVDGIQRVRPGQAVAPGPAESAPIAAPRG
ncbi:MAG TPA: efflux RND transporter periplasmic adaptor subunit [Stellaceae bacterium]|nr:efflux RND transporter periplasmic adaptor subunit [Stellaceae bacterium]